MLCNYLNLNASWFQSQLNIYLFALLISFSIRIYMQSKRQEQRKNIINTIRILQQDSREIPDSPSWMRGSCGEDQQKEPSCYSSVYMHLFSGKSRYHFLFLKDQTHQNKYFSCVRLMGSNNGCGTFCVRQFIVFHHSLRFPKSHTSAVQWLESG